MDPRLAGHYARVRHLRESFAEANERFVARLRRADPHAVERQPAGGGWSPAQIGLHVARVTTRFAGLIAGDAAGVEALPPGFQERPWTAIVPEIPDRLQAPGAFEPPAHATRDEAIAALEASGVRLAQAFDVLTPDRGEHFGITSRIVGGTISVYQIGEWATAHVIRHNRQAKRLLGEG